ncbi:MAG: hypothetical protein Q8O88_01235 [bacterium]|nr:hypothetical protein [bacterium]
MKLAWISELGFEGTVDPNEPNQRVDLVWQIALNTYHYNWERLIEDQDLQLALEEYDAVLCVIPKNNPYRALAFLFEKLQTLHTKIIIVQEGPCYYWHDWSSKNQIFYLEILKGADGVFVHGETDRKYYEGLLGRKVYILPTMINLEYFNTLSKIQKTPNSAMIGGTACQWYAGQASASIVKDNSKIQKVFFPSMGRKIEDEDILMRHITNKEITYFPYTTWSGFITLMSQCEYAIHLMPASAAATFNLNCAALGIPCIGNRLADTQQELFPDLSVEVTDLTKAKELLTALTEDPNFYAKVVAKALANVKKFDTKTCAPIVSKNIQEILNVDKQ